MRKIMLGGLYIAIACGAAWAGSEPAPARTDLNRTVLEEKVLADFLQGVGSAKALHVQAKVEASGVALAMTLPGRAENPSVQMWAGESVDLTGYDALRMTVENVAGGRAAASFRLYAADGTHTLFAIPLDPGANVLHLPIRHALKFGTTDRFDFAKAARLELSIARQKDDARFTVGKLSAVKIYEDGGSLRCFDFGGGEVFHGAIPVRASTVYEKGRGYGLGGKDLKDRTWEEFYPLFGDVVDGGDLTFRVDLPDGAYEAQVVAFGVNWQDVRNVSYKVLANGQVVVDRQVTKESFYSFNGLYYGANIFYEPGHSIFDQYHRAYYAPARFDVAAVDGHVDFSFEGCGPRAIFIYPKAKADDGRAYVDGAYSASAYELWLHTARVREHEQPGDFAAASPADTQRGYQVFARSYQYRVYPNDQPLKSEPVGEGGLEVACAANESEPVTFTIRPLKDLGETKITYSALAAGDHTIPASAFESFFVKYFPQQVSGIQYEAVPTLLYPYEPRALKQGWNHTLWATLRIPAGTPAGVYAGNVTIEPGLGEKSVIPIRVTVRPFELPQTKSENGMWNNTAFGSHGLDLFRDNAEYTRKILDAEVRDLMDHGLSGYTIGAPHAVKFDTANNTVQLDFDQLNLIAEAIKKNGMSGRQVVTFTNLLDYGLLRPAQGYKEFSPGYNAAVKNILEQIRDWMKEKGVHGLVQVYDEPRETELNAWNRNRRDSIQYLKLAREVPGLKTMVTLMADKDAFNRPYTPLIPLMDLVSTHSWPRSDDTIYLASVEKVADLWIYNNGFTRFTHGFYLWKSKALGHWQWVFSWEVSNAHLPVFYPHDTSAAYAWPGGFLNTLKFEHIREGVDDHRYLELLEEKLADAPKDNASALEARRFLKALDAFLPQYPHDTGQTSGAEAGGMYDESKETTYFQPWREQIAEYLSALVEKRAAKKLDAAWAMFPQQAVSEERKVVCQLIDKAQAPTIDGKSEDDAWKNAPEATGFVNLARGILAPVQTKVKTVCDGENLYFLFTCTEPKYGELKAYAINRDEDCWMDDSVEAFLDVKRDKKTYKHVIVNCLGAIQDADGRDPLWNGDIHTAVQKDKGLWRVEFFVSLKSLGAEVPTVGTVWGINLCRNRQPQPPESSSYAFVGHSFHNPAMFGTMEFKK